MKKCNLISSILLIPCLRCTLVPVVWFSFVVFVFLEFFYCHILFPINTACYLFNWFYFFKRLCQLCCSCCCWVFFPLLLFFLNTTPNLCVRVCACVRCHILVSVAGIIALKLLDTGGTLRESLEYYSTERLSGFEHQVGVSCVIRRRYLNISKSHQYN